MKVGVFVHQIHAEGVTAASYEQSTLDALARSNSNHEFYVFTNSNLEKVKHKLHAKLIYVCIKDFDSFFLNRHLAKILLLAARLIFKIIRIPKLKKRVEWILTVTPLNKALLKYNIRIFWQSFGEEKIDIPYIQTCYDCNDRVHPYLPEFSVNADSWIAYNNLRKNLFQRASYIIAGTEQLKNELMHYYGVDENKIRKIPLFVPEINKVNTYIETADLDKKSLPSKFLFYPARFIPQKNHVVILRALKILKQKYEITIPVIFVGIDKGNKEYILNKAREYGLQEEVHYKGVVSFNDLHYLYSRAFALVFAPLNGPDNLPPLEAFSLGCPVIASNVSGAQEQLGDAALLFESTDEHQLAEHIASLSFNEDLRKTLIMKGYKRVENLGVDSYISSLIKIVDDFEKIAVAWEGSNYQYLSNLSVREDGIINTAVLRSLRFIAKCSPVFIKYRILNFIYHSKKIIGNNIKITINNGLKMFLNPQDWVQSQIFVFNYYEKKETTFVDNILKEGDVFMDIGANVGYYTLIASKKIGTGKVLSFEPELDNYNSLNSNIGLNQLNNVLTFRLAVSDKIEKVSLSRAGVNNRGMHSLFKDAVYSNNSAEVDAVTLDSFVEVNKINKISLIKMDIEGAEMLALKGMQSTLGKFQPDILIEINKEILSKANVQIEEIYDFLGKLNYIPYIINDKAEPVKIDKPTEGELIFFTTKRK